MARRTLTRRLSTVALLALWSVSSLAAGWRIYRIPVRPIDIQAKVPNLSLLGTNHLGTTRIAAGTAWKAQIPLNTRFRINGDVLLAAVEADGGYNAKLEELGRASSKIKSQSPVAVCQKIPAATDNAGQLYAYVDRNCLSVLQRRSASKAADALQFLRSPSGQAYFHPGIGDNAMRVFISHRRNWLGKPSQMAVNLTVALKASGVDVVLGRDHVRNQDKFANELVDHRLNKCDALVAIIDARWLMPRNLRRLLDSAAVQQCTDWVEFEIRYALHSGLATVFVGERVHLAAIANLPKTAAMGHLAGCACFQVDGTHWSRAAVDDLVRDMRSLRSPSPRRPPDVVADVRHNPAAMSNADALALYKGAGRLARMGGPLQFLLRTLAYGLAAIAMFLAIGAALDGKLLGAAAARYIGRAAGVRSPDPLCLEQGP